jgi:hypothetical protein
MNFPFYLKTSAQRIFYRRVRQNSVMERQKPQGAA